MPHPDDKPEGHSRCSECGFRIRGPNHEEGRHHSMAVQRRADHGPRSTGEKITSAGGWI